MKSVRNVLFVFLATATLLGTSACLSETDGNNLNPQPLPPATDEPGQPPPPENGDKQTGSGGSMGSDNPAPTAGTADAGAPDAAHVSDRLSAPWRNRD